MGTRKEEVVEVRQPQEPDLKPDSKRLLIAGLSAASGYIMRTSTAYGVCFSAGNKPIADNLSARDAVKWNAALGQLEQYGYVQHKTKDGYQLTETGYERGEALHDEDPVLSLSKEAKELLVNVADDPGGHVQFVTCDGGNAVLTNGQQFGAIGNPKDSARWEAALQEIVQRGFVKSHSGDDFYTMTKTGYEAAKQLSGE